MKRWVGFAIGAALLAAAAGVAATAPNDGVATAPFVARGELGDAIGSQHLVATVRDPQLAQEVELGFWRGTTDGVWLVVEVTAVATTEYTLIDADVFLGGVRYPGTMRASGDTVSGSGVDAGFPVTGPVLVELPANVVDLPGANAAVLRFSPGGDARLDSVIEVVIDLTKLDFSESVELEPTRDGER